MSDRGRKRRRRVRVDLADGALDASIPPARSTAMTGSKSGSSCATDRRRRVRDLARSAGADRGRSERTRDRRPAGDGRLGQRPLPPTALGYRRAHRPRPALCRGGRAHRRVRDQTGAPVLGRAGARHQATGGDVRCSS